MSVSQWVKPIDLAVRSASRESNLPAKSRAAKSLCSAKSAEVWIPRNIKMLGRQTILTALIDRKSLFAALATRPDQHFSKDFAMHTHDVRAAARALGGDVSGRDSIVCPGPGHSERDRSLSVRLIRGSEGGFLVYSHAGDSIRECKDHVRERLGLAPWRPRHRARSNIRRHIPEPPTEQHAKHLSYARSIWDAAKPAKGTLVEQYLVQTRKLELPETDAIRFHPRLRVTHTDRFAPAMVCRTSDIHTDEFTGVHRTFLTDTAQKISKTILGRKHGSAIKIDADNKASEGLAIAEGAETVIATRHLYRPAWSVIDAGGMRHFPVLAGIEHLEIFADHDANGAGEAAARYCLERWKNAGAEVAIVMPPTVGSDIADFIANKKVY
jgi:putative DNA primase/helicase